MDNGYSGFGRVGGEWEDALTQLVESNALRQMMARRLIKVVEKHHSLAGNLWRWPAAWSTIAESANERRIILGTGAKDVRRGVILA